MRAELEPLGFKVEWKDMRETGRAGHLIATHVGKPGTKRLLLIAHRLSFEHPVLKVPMRIQAPLGPEVLGLFARLGWPASEQDYGA